MFPSERPKSRSRSRGVSTCRCRIRSLMLGACSAIVLITVSPNSSRFSSQLPSFKLYGAYKLKEGNLDEKRDEFGDTVINTIAEFITLLIPIAFLQVVRRILNKARHDVFARRSHGRISQT